MTFSNRHIRNGFLILVALGLVIGGLQANSQMVKAANASNAQDRMNVSQPKPSSSSGTNLVFLPFATNLAPRLFSQTLIGVYTPGIYPGSQQFVDQYLTGLDSWAGLSRAVGRGHSIYGDFVDWEHTDPNSYVLGPLELLWNDGYTEFLNLSITNRTSAAIAGGCCDASITAWAHAYKTWVDKGGNRKAYLAPLEEMNGSWTPYGLDPPNFKLAYQRILNLFAAQGVTRDKVWWVFAPNGWSTPPYGIQAYYPGDDKVDMVGFSSYNQSCKVPWMTPAVVFNPYIQEIRTVAPSKPIFVAETASASLQGDKDQWIRDAYSLLVQQNIRMILYYNGDRQSVGECDWAVYVPGGKQVQGYKDAVSSANFVYVDPATLSGMTILP